MATSPSQVLESIDYSGISVVTASKDASVPRQGMIYDPLNLAAATPIYFHDLGENNYLAIFSQRWVNAVQSLSVPGHYTSYTANTTPSWAIVHSVNGAKEPVGGSFVIPMVTKNDSRVVTAACSRMINLLCLLNTVTYAGVNYAVVQTFHCTNNGVVNRISEETIPNLVADGQTVIFDRCIYLSDPFLIAVGSGSDDNSLYLARKRYATVGSASSPWEYQTSRGWTANADEIQRLMSTDGEVMTTHGPCSAASYRGTICMSTVQADGSARSARLYISNGLQWTPGTSFPLGDAGSSYLGGLYLQPLLGAVSQTSSAGYPFVTSQLSTADGASTITTSWSVSRMTGGVAFEGVSGTTVSVSRPATINQAGHFATSLSSTVSISAAATFNVFSSAAVTATLTASMVKNAINTTQTYTATTTSTATRGHVAAAPLESTLTIFPVVRQGQPFAASAAVTASSTPAALKGIGVSATLSATASMDATASLNTLPFSLENFSVTNGTVPEGTSGCWVTLIGGGGHGWYTGGGGGARVDRVWIPVASLGATYTITRGLGVNQNSGTASVFSSGSITLTAGGGIRGDSGGAGGTASAVGITATTHNGTNGGTPGWFANGTQGVDDATNNVGAGGGGAGYNAGGGRGGNSKTRSGTTSGTPTAAAAGDGGAGSGGNTTAPGGLYGGGGGGNYTSTGGAWGGIGGNGYCLVEWVA